MIGSRRRGRLALLTGVVLTFPDLLGAQVGPGPPEPPSTPAVVRLPPTRDTVLVDGAELLAVTQHEVPLVTVSFVFSGGAAADPPGRTGTAHLLAALLEAGAREDVAALGGDLSASAGPDWITVTLSVLSDRLDEGLPVLVDAVLRPAFPAADVAEARHAAVVALEARSAALGAVADRVLRKEVYGDHPYGRMETSASLGAVGSTDLATFHDTWFRPRGTLVVVAGDADVDAVAGRLEALLAGWSGAAPVPAALRPVPRPPPAGPRLVLVHRPGSVHAAIRAGTALVPGSAPAWDVLPLVDQLLGGGSSGSLHRALREAGIGFGARTTLERRRAWGLFESGTESMAAVAPRALRALLGGLRAAATTFPMPEDLGRARSRLAGSFHLATETPGQVAARRATLRLLGVEPTDLAGIPAAIEGLGPQDVRDAVAAHLDPDHMVVVVAGDATVLRDSLEAFGPLTLVDEAGRPLEAEDLAIPGRPPPLDASRLRPLTLEYRITAGERVVGRLHRELVRTRVGLTWLGRSTLGDRTVEQSVTFTTPGFEPVGASVRVSGPGLPDAVLDARVEGRRLVGSMDGVEGGARRVDAPVPEGAVVGDMLELAVGLLPLAEGTAFTFPWLHPETGAVENVAVQVEVREEVSVPAGTFDTWRVRIGGLQPLRLWIRADDPRIAVRVEPLGQPVEFELVEVTEDGGGSDADPGPPPDHARPG